MPLICTCGDVFDEHANGEHCEAMHDGVPCPCVQYEWDGESEE